VIDASTIIRARSKSTNQVTRLVPGLRKRIACLITQPS